MYRRTGTQLSPRPLAPYIHPPAESVAHEHLREECRGVVVGASFTDVRARRSVGVVGKIKVQHTYVGTAVRGPSCPPVREFGFVEASLQKISRFAIS